MRGIRVSILLAALSVLSVLGIFSCGTQQRDEKVVFIDLEVVISEEKKRIFSRVLRGELSREGGRGAGRAVFPALRGGPCRL